VRLPQKKRGESRRVGDCGEVEERGVATRVVVHYHTQRLRESVEFPTGQYKFTPLSSAEGCKFYDGSLSRINKALTEGEGLNLF
jgi:hypothetical protein